MPFTPHTLSNAWHKVKNFGVRRDLPADEQKRITMTNALILITIGINVSVTTLTMISELLATGNVSVTGLPGLISYGLCAIVSLGFQLNQRGHYLRARYLLLSIWWFFITAMCIVFGEAIRFDQYFLTLMAIPLMIFKQRSHMLFAFAVSVLLNAACQINYRINDALIITPEPFADYRYALHSIFMVAMLYGIIFYFKYLNEKHEFQIQEEIEVRKQTELALQLANEKAIELANTDFLTGVHNRRFFYKQAERIFNEHDRYNNNLSLILIDLDHFKRVNDQYGHAVGDEVLVAVSSLLKNMTRNTDVLARIGGEEFAILLPQTSMEDAFTQGERLRHATQQLSIQSDTHTVSITLSLGIADRNSDIKSFDDLFNLADIALYQAKHRGRNQLVISNG
ncbi:MAG: hypothetical protein AseanaTS_00120 [Candidatus Pelagadaptatus aseana]|uniref:GGDEF domain-containing protein n=1 Tax=Candidatus Pelagadaptatus aseana TaxID=3120508 RepID=UPI0039B2BDE2